MRKSFCLFIFLLINKLFAFDYEWDGNTNHLGMIRTFINHYEETARKNCLDKLPPSKGRKWTFEFHNKIKNLDSLRRDTLRYPDVYKNILLYDQRIDIIKDYWCEHYYDVYMSPEWAYSLFEKKEKIAKESDRFNSYALICKQVLYDNRDKIINAYVEFFEECLKKNRACLNVYHDYGLLAYMHNNFDKSQELLNKLIDKAQETDQMDKLDSKVYHDLGTVHLETMAYDKAIKYLSKAIKLDPNNKEAYFQRAFAYFEKGDFDQAIEDYLISDKMNTISVSNNASIDFTDALLANILQGSAESTIDFIPSLCSSVYGLSKTLWATHKSVNPLNPKSYENIKNFAHACYEMGECLVDYCINMDADTINEYVDEIKSLFTHYDQLSDSEKGKLIGYTVGRYSVDIFAGALTGTMTAKGMQLASKTTPFFHNLRNLRNANRVCNFEAMLLSETEKKAIIASSLEHAAARESYFKNVKIQWDKQNKHIPGKHNFESGKGRILIEESELEALVKEHAGTGNRVCGQSGEANFKERVDFGKIIGEYAQEIEGKSTTYIPTSKGIITYAKDGSAHVYPTNPHATLD